MDKNIIYEWMHKGKKKKINKKIKIRTMLYVNIYDILMTF
jgi:hypothetical protein